MSVLSCCPCGGRRRNGHCDRCGRGPNTDNRPSAHARGYDRDWNRASRDYREGRVCVCCDAKGIVRLADLTDHIRPHKGDERIFWDTDNWQPLCRSCHDNEKQSIERQYEGSEHLIRAAWMAYLREVRRRVDAPPA